MCRQNFYTSDYEEHRARNPTPVPGTCKWILEHKLYQNWLKAEASSLLWISANPGCGKSVMISFLISHHENQTSVEEEVNACYFFFKTDSPQQRDPVHALCALLHQIYTSQPLLIKHAMAELISKGENFNLGTLWKIFINTIEDKQSRPTICFIDALDEMDPIRLSEFVMLLSRYFVTQQQTRKRHSGPYLKFLLTSRPVNSIKAAFDFSPPVSDNMDIKGESSSRAIQEPKVTPFTEQIFVARLRGEDQIDAINQDIELVVKAAIQRLIQGGFPKEILRGLELEIIKRADRTFLWASLIIKLIQQHAEAGASKRELDEILHGRRFDTIDTIYAGLLKGKSSPGQVRKLLSIMLAATRPLTLKELNVALAIEPDRNTFEDSYTERRPGHGTFEALELDLRHPFENYIHSLCGHFVRVIQGKVYFVHETAREFLLPADAKGPRKPIQVPTSSKTLDAVSNPESSDNNEKENSASTLQHSFSLRSSHAVLLELCCTYLYFLGKSDGQYPNSEAGSFLTYASKSWISHFHNVCNGIPEAAFKYYHQLCHPLFPGFNIWLTEGCHDRLEGLGMSVDDEQVWYIHLFQLERRAKRRQSRNPSKDALSSNPGAFNNHNFPLRVDSFGVVALDLRDVEGRARRLAKAREVQKASPAEIVVRGFKIP